MNFSGPNSGRPGRRLGFSEQADVADHHALVYRLAHVIDGQGRNGYGGQSFHFDTRGCRDSGRCGDPDTIPRFGCFKVNLTMGNGQGMTQRD